MRCFNNNASDLSLSPDTIYRIVQRVSHAFVVVRRNRSCFEWTKKRKKFEHGSSSSMWTTLNEPIHSPDKPAPHSTSLLLFDSRLLTAVCVVYLPVPQTAIILPHILFWFYYTVILFVFNVICLRVCACGVVAACDVSSTLWMPQLTVGNAPVPKVHFRLPRQNGKRSKNFHFKCFIHVNQHTIAPDRTNCID